MDEQMKSDLLLTMAIAFGIMMIFRLWPRIQAKMMGVPFISSEEAKNYIERDDALVIDVRTKGEFTSETGHIDGALNLDSVKLLEKLTELGDKLEPYKTQPIIVTCRTHNRSPRAARILFQNGFQNLMILNNGMVGWNRAGYPVKR